MKNKEYYYVPYSTNSSSEFKKICKKIFGSVRGIRKDRFAVDVDGSTIQRFKIKNQEIVVIDDYDFGYIYINSDIDLKDLFGKSLAA